MDGEAADVTTLLLLNLGAKFFNTDELFCGNDADDDSVLRDVEFDDVATGRRRRVVSGARSCCDGGG